MSRYILDIETNGLWDTVSQVHSIVMYDIDNKVLHSFANYGGYTPIAESIPLIQDATFLVMHNGLDYDLPVLKKVLKVETKAKVFDTLLMSQLMFTNMYDSFGDEERKLPGKLQNSHSLEAWGHRLGKHKGDYTGPWDFWNVNMQKYCERDVVVTFKLYQKLTEQPYAQEAIDLELALGAKLHRINKHGFLFDRDKAIDFYAELSDERSRLTRELVDVFGSWVEPDGLVTPKRTICYKDPLRADVYEGGTYTRIKFVTFNPNSRQHIVNRLKHLYKWEPAEFTEKGNPIIDNDTLDGLDYPEAKLLSRYFLLNKRIGQLAEGAAAWLKSIGNDGRIHGSMMQNGCRSGRCTHYSPNMAQIPSCGKEYGTECRSLFIAPKNKLIVGCDADGLELRCLAGYMKKWDKGAYIHAVTQGTKEDGTDIHSLNAAATGLDRSTVKTVMYAMIYGGGDAKLGLTVAGQDLDYKLRSIGAEVRSNLESSVVGFKQLTELVKEKYNTKGYILGLDGRKLYPVGAHAALNMLLQSAGAIIMKRAYVIADDQLQKFYKPGVDYEFVGFIHDEFQIEAREDIADKVGQVAAKAIVRAGEYYNFPCPMAGNYAIGKSWAETH